MAFAPNGLRHHATSNGDNLKLDTVSGTESIDIEKVAVVGE
jgi:hypothetical protein